MIIPLRTSTGRELRIEVTPEQTGYTEAGLRDRVGTAAETAADAFGTLRDTIGGLVEELAATQTTLGDAGQEMTVTLDVGVRFDVGTGFVIATTKAGADLRIKIEWRA